MSVKLLIGMTGSIGVLNMPAYLFILKKTFLDLQVIMTNTAQQFISKETITLFSQHVHTDMFLSSREGANPIQLARWADLILVMPATAHTMSQVAQGLAGSFLTTVILAHEKPVLFFPNMNPSIWNNPAFQRNISLLQLDGHQIITSDEEEAYEYATGNKSIEKNIPSPDKVVEIIREEMERRHCKVGER